MKRNQIFKFEKCKNKFTWGISSDKWDLEIISHFDASEESGLFESWLVIDMVSDNRMRLYWQPPSLCFARLREITWDSKAKNFEKIQV